MLKNKRILLIIIFTIALFLIPNMCNAINATETTKTSTGVEVKWSYELNENDEIVELLCTNKESISGSIDIPATIDGKTVRVIGNKGAYSWNDSAFKGCSGLTGITIPNTVTTIANYSFSNCVGLKSITIPEGVTSIEDRAFEGCVGVKSITISNSVNKIGGGAFEGCVGIENLVLPDNITSIGDAAFKDCKGLKSITLPKNLTQISRETFFGCTSLTEVVIPDNVTIIDGYDGTIYGAFQDCTNLTKVLIPDTVATILKSAFRNCPKVTIYGNDNQASKKYAEDNDINFEYIADWDKAAVGDDITPPTLKSLEIAWGTAFVNDSGTGYYLVSAGVNISIKATFDEKIYGETAPRLTIKCGNGEKIELTNGSIQGEYIIYTYMIKEQDKGIITAVSMTGGDVADEAGNKVEKYVCPELVTDIWSKYVYANGKGSATTDEGNNGQNNGGNKEENNGGNNAGNNQNPPAPVTLSAIAITKTPTRNTYMEGEKFDKSGMVITATYSDGTTKQITNYSVSPSAELKVGDTQVVITYTENGVTKTIGQKITVITKVVNNNDKTENTNKNNTSKNNTIKDNTVKNDNKLPQTGTTLLSLVVISLIVVAVVSKVKYGAYKDI